MLHDTFGNTFLCAIHNDGDASNGAKEVSSNSLSMLNKKELKMAITEFVGVPRGRLVRNMLLDLRSLAHPQLE